MTNERELKIGSGTEWTCLALVPLCLRFFGHLGMDRGSLNTKEKEVSESDARLPDQGRSRRGRRGHEGLNGRYWADSTSSSSPSKSRSRSVSSRTKARRAREKVRFSREDFLNRSHQSHRSPLPGERGSACLVTAAMPSFDEAVSAPDAAASAAKNKVDSPEELLNDPSDKAAMKWMNKKDREGLLRLLRDRKAAQEAAAKPGATGTDVAAAEKAGSAVMMFKLDAAAVKKRQAAEKAKLAAAKAAKAAKTNSSSSSSGAAGGSASSKGKTGGKPEASGKMPPPPPPKSSSKVKGKPESMEVDAAKNNKRVRSPSRDSSKPEEGGWGTIGKDGKPEKKKSNKSDADVVINNDAHKTSAALAAGAPGAAAGKAVKRVFPVGPENRSKRVTLANEIVSKLWVDDGQFDGHKEVTGSRTNSPFAELWEIDCSGQLHALWKKHKSNSDGGRLFRADLAEVALGIRSARQGKSVAKSQERTVNHKNGSAPPPPKAAKKSNGVGYAEKAKAGITVASAFYLRVYRRAQDCSPAWKPIEEKEWKSVVARTYLQLAQVTADFPTAKRGYSNFGYGYFICNGDADMRMLKDAVALVAVDTTKYVALTREELTPATVIVEVSSNGDGDIFEGMDNSLEEISKAILANPKNGLDGLPDGSIVRDRTARKSASNKAGGRNACISYRVTPQAWEIICKKNKGLMKVYCEEWWVFWGSVPVSAMSEFPNAPRRVRGSDDQGAGAVSPSGGGAAAVSASGSAAAASSSGVNPMDVDLGPGPASPTQEDLELLEDDPVGADDAATTNS